jgi:SAM-dependent methyltransferase
VRPLLFERGLLAIAGCLLLQACVPHAAPYVSTPEPVVEGMLQIAQVGRQDVVYDLGSGDGRIVIAAAARHGARGVGIDFDPARVREAREHARAAGVADRVEFRQADVLAVDIGEATVVTLYLGSDLNMRLRPKLLAELRPGTRIVSHVYDMGDWKPMATSYAGGRRIYYWVVPPRE